MLAMAGVLEIVPLTRSFPGMVCRVRKAPWAIVAAGVVALAMMGTIVVSGPIETHAAASTGTPGPALAWGSNAAGQLGNGTTTDSSTPVAVLGMPSGTTVTAVAGGLDYSLALTSSGQVLAWGANGYGQLGNGTTTYSSTPVAVHLPIGTTINAIASGYAHSLALTSTGQVLAWGYNSSGQLGNGTTSPSYSTTPVQVSLPSGSNVTAVAGGASHSLALTSTGQVLAWGRNLEGQLGNGTTTDSSTPVAVVGAPSTAIAAGG
jgi:alpha-tubulin suppressor-like RCC1 family protein